MFEKVIFLDIDGVLNCNSSVEMCECENGSIIGVDDDKLSRLAAIVQYTGADLVLSSSWKEGWFDNWAPKQKHVEYLEKRLAQHGLKIKSITQGHISGSYYRGREIMGWLMQHPQTKEWVILDDEAWGDFFENPYIEGHWVWTSYKRGLTDSDAETAISILQGWLLSEDEFIMNYHEKQEWDIIGEKND